MWPKISSPVCSARGQTPAESDYQLLEVARRLEMYGIRLHPANDRESTRLSLAVEHTGVLVFQVSHIHLYVQRPAGVIYRQQCTNVGIKCEG